MPVATESVEFRRPRSQFGQLISEADPNPSHEIRSIIQSTRCKSTISSLLLSTFSNTSAINEPQAQAQLHFAIGTKKKNNFTLATFRGLGCSAGSTQEVSVPAVIRTSADWDSKRARKRMAKKPTRGLGGEGRDRSALLNGSHHGCAVDFQDMWCEPGIGFSADAAAFVDCVVVRRNVAGADGGGSMGKIDGEISTMQMSE